MSLGVLSRLWLRAFCKLIVSLLNKENRNDENERDEVKARLQHLQRKRKKLLFAKSSVESEDRESAARFESEYKYLSDHQMQICGQMSVIEEKVLGGHVI